VLDALWLDDLLKEKPLALHCGREGVDIIRARLYSTQRELAYLERSGGYHDIARRRILNLIRQWPFRTELYVDLLKSVVPPALAAKLQLLKTQLS
jgi:hypothetical protein